MEPDLSTDLSGRVCLVTGANAGIGREVARGLARCQATVVLACRDVRKGEAARAEIAADTGNRSLEVLAVDLSRQAEVRRASGELQARHRALHVLVNNAGIWSGKRLESRGTLGVAAMPTTEELLNVYDPAGVVIGARPRREAKASGLAVGAVNALLVNARGEVLLQRRPADKENGGLWDKSVGGHVSAGEDFDQTLVREAGEELFDDPGSTRILLASHESAFRSSLAARDLQQTVVLRRVALQHNLRDIRRAPGGGLRTVIYHVAIYAGRTDVPLEAFRPQPDEIAELRYAPPAEVDRLFLQGELAPNMGFLWLTQARALVGLVEERRD